MAHRNNPKTAKYVCTRKKSKIGSFIDEQTFDFPFLQNEDTVSYIKKHGNIMFIIRGPPSTGKATLSNLIMKTYPEACFCCADKFFESKEQPRNRDLLKLSHKYCADRAEKACINKEKVIVVQNTHIRKWEMQSYIDLAAQFNYTIVMAITLYRFNVTAEALESNNDEGLDLSYFRNRLRQWEDVFPAFTGWFLSPIDRDSVLHLSFRALEGLLGDGKFCREFGLYDMDAIMNYYEARKSLFSPAGFSTVARDMKKYYLSDFVQDNYGKCVAIHITGYLVSVTDLKAIVHINQDMEPLIFEGDAPAPKREFDLADALGKLQINTNLLECTKTTQLKRPIAAGDEPLEGSSVELVESNAEDDFKVSRVSFMTLAEHSRKDLSKVSEIMKNVKDVLSAEADEDGNIKQSSFTELDDGLKVCRLPENVWLVKASKKIAVKAVFTGLYT